MTMDTMAGISTSSSQTSEPEAQTGLSKDQHNQLVQWAVEQFTIMKANRAYAERQWYLNLSFYYGKQNVVYRANPNLVFGANGSLYVPPAPYWRVRPVFNRCKPIIRREIAKLNSTKPTVNVMPASTEDRDIFAAQAGEDIWESTYRRLNLARVFRRASFWTQTCGTGYIKTYWDPTIKDPESVPQEIPPELEALGIQPPETSGDFVVQHETPFHVFVPDLREEELEKQPYLIHAQMKNAEWIKMFFGHDFTDTSGLSNEMIIDDSWINLIGANNNQKGNKQILVLECWVKPGALPMFPEGGLFTVAGNQIMPPGVTFGWPYQHGMYPFSKLESIPSGKYYSESTLVDLIPIQKEYNRTRGQIIEAKNRMAKPQLIAEQGSVDPAKITTEPGQVILYKTGFQPPQPLPLQDMPSYVINEVQQLQQDFDVISGQTEVSRGETPTGVTAATAIAYLQEQDDTILSHAYQSYEEGIEKCAKLILAYANQYWSEERIIKVIGPGGSFDAKAFKGSDLRGNTDVRVEGGSALPQSKAATQAFLMDLMNAGHIDPQKGLELMQIGSLSKLYETVHLDIRQAQRENLKLAVITPDMMQEHQMAAQQDFQQNPDDYFEPSDPMAPMRQPVEAKPIVPVNTYDNHEIHIQIHNDYRKSQEFENADDMVKQLFEDHVNAHISALSAVMMGAGMAPMPPESPGPEPMPETSM